MSKDTNPKQKVQNFCKYLSIIPDLNAIMSQQFKYEHQTSVIVYNIVGAFIDFYYGITSNNEIYLEYLQVLLSTYDVDITQIVIKTNQFGEVEFKMNLLCFAVLKTNINVIKLLLKYKRHQMDTQKLNVKYQGKTYSTLEWIKQETQLNDDNKKEILKLLSEGEHDNNLCDLDSEMKLESEKFNNDSNNDNNVSIDENGLKEVFESILYDSLVECNFFLFDILIDLWQSKMAPTHGLINVFKFGKSDNNLLQIIANQYGNDQNHRNLSMIFAVFEKYWNQFKGDAATINTMIKDSQFIRIFEQSIEDKSDTFISKLCHIVFITNQSLCHVSGIFSKLVEITNNKDNIHSILGNVDQIFSRNKHFMLQMDTMYLSCEILVTILQNSHAVQWIELLHVKNYFRIFGFIQIHHLLTHPQMIKIIEILELQCSFVLECGGEYKYIQSMQARSSLLSCAVDRDNIYFLNHWFRILQQKSQQYELTKEILTIVESSHAQLITYIQSAKMIDFLIDKGWKLPQINDLLKVENVSPILIEYIIEKRKIQITLNHLQMRMDCINSSTNINSDIYPDHQKWNLDVIYVLLKRCDEATRIKFVGDVARYCNKNQKLLIHLQLLFKFAFEMKPSSSEHNHSFDEIEIEQQTVTNLSIYFSAKRKVCKFDDDLWSKTQLAIGNDLKSLLQLLFNYYIQMDIDSNSTYTKDMIDDLLSEIFWADWNDDEIEMMLEKSIIHNNLKIVQQILNSDPFWEKRFKMINRCYMMALDYNYNYKVDNHELVSYLQNFINENYNNGDDGDLRTEMKIDKLEEMSKHEYYYVPLNMIENSLLKLYDRYVKNNIGIDQNSTQLKNDFINCVYCNEQYFHNPNYQYRLQSSNVTIQTPTYQKGMYLFHLIASNVDMYGTLKCIINSNLTKMKALSGKDPSMWLLCDKNQNTIIECIVFGSYNEKYQRLKFKYDQKKDNNNHFDKSDFVKLLHQIQQKTIDVKFNNIV